MSFTRLQIWGSEPHSGSLGHSVTCFQGTLILPCHRPLHPGMSRADRHAPFSPNPFVVTPLLPCSDARPSAWLPSRSLSDTLSPAPPGHARSSRLLGPFPILSTFFARNWNPALKFQHRVAFSTPAYFFTCTITSSLEKLQTLWKYISHSPLLGSHP